MVIDRLYAEFVTPLANWSIGQPDAAERFDEFVLLWLDLENLCTGVQFNSYFKKSN